MTTGMTTRRIIAAIVAAALFWGSGSALAQSPAGSPPTQAAQTETDQAADGAEKVSTMAEIEVRSAVRREELRSTSAVVLTNDDLTGRIYNQPLDILLKTPGASISDFGAPGVANEVMIRSFKGGHGHDGGNMAFFLDGIPLQDSGHDDNYMDTNVVIPLEIESVEIIKGPQSVFYGPRAGTGAMAFQTYKTGDFTRMHLRYGSDNDVDTQGIIAKTQNDLSHVYAFQFRHTDGWRENSDWNLANVSGRWTYQFTDQFSASLNLRANKSTGNNAGYLRSDLNLPDTAWVDDGSGEGGGVDRQRFDGRLWANYLLNDESQITFYTFGTDLENTRWSKSFPSGNPSSWSSSSRSGSENTNSHKAYGLGTAYNFKGDIADHESSISVGVDYLRENEIRDSYRLMWGTGRARGQQTVQQDYILNTASLFGSASYQVLDPLQVRLGARYDRFTGSLDTGPNNSANVGPDKNLKAAARDAVSPRAGLLLTPLDWLDVYTNYGQAYKIPALNDGTFFDDPDAELTKHNQFELGYRARPMDWLDLEMTYYYINTLNDSTYDRVEDEWTYAGKTERQGLETTASLRPFEFWSLSGHYTYQDAKYKKFDDGSRDYAGLRLPEVPRHVTALELAYAPVEGLGGRVNFRWQADALVDQDFKDQDKGALDLQLSYKFNDEYKLTFDVLNVTDQRAYAYRYGTPDVFNYTVQPPRTFYVGLEANWR